MLMKMADQDPDLPDECWELIFNSLGHHQHLEPLSLVCKRFLSITNSLRTSLTITDQIAPILSIILERFPRLQRVDVDEFTGDINQIVYQIAESGLEFEELDLSNKRGLPVNSFNEIGSRLTTLKILNCSRLVFLEDRDLNVIASSLPWLEELDISNPQNDFESMDEWGILKPITGTVTDTGVEILSTRLRKLRKIDLSGNPFISDRSLFALSSNCKFLREIGVCDCCFITQNGLGFMMRHSPNLVSVSINAIEIHSLINPSLSSTIMANIENSLVYAKGLCSIDFSYSSLSDQFLNSIAKAGLPLKRLTLSHCYNFTLSGVASILYAYQSLTHLSLVKSYFLTDQCMILLCKFLKNLISINLNFCSNLTNLTFFTITESCPLLNHIEMERTSLGIENSTPDFGTNPQVTTLKLARNAYLTNETMKKFVALCPKLQMIDLSYCQGVSDEGVSEVLKGCTEIRHLSVNHCGGIKNIGIDLDRCKLETFQVRGSGISDESVAEIGRRCSGMLYLDLEGCLNVTTKGIKELVKNCRVLKEINLRCCNNVSVDIVAWMVFTMPSLRRIIPPSDFVSSDSKRNFLLRHGCLVC